MTFILGITGSIAMGKSTVARLFGELGAKVSDADAAVHQLLEEDKGLIADIAQKFPGTVENDTVNRPALGQQVFADNAKLKELEALLHPKIHAKNMALRDDAKKEGWKLLVLDIPLLYETQAEQICDAVLVVTARPEIQYERAMERIGMTDEKFRQIVSRQMSDKEKRQRADYIIDTSNGLEDTREQVQALISKL